MDHAENVARSERVNGTDDVCLQIDRQWNRLEIARLRLLEKLVEIETCHGNQFAGDVLLNPGSGFEFRRAIELQERFFSAPGIAHHGPRIAGQIFAVNDQRGNRAAPRRLFKFVGPAAVVGERLALEKVRIVGNRLVDKEQCDFPLRS